MKLPEVVTIFVCPDCQAYHVDTCGGHPCYSTCAIDGHRPARTVELRPPKVWPQP